MELHYQHILMLLFILKNIQDGCQHPVPFAAYGGIVEDSEDPNGEFMPFNKSDITGADKEKELSIVDSNGSEIQNENVNKSRSTGLSINITADEMATRNQNKRNIFTTDITKARNRSKETNNTDYSTIKKINPDHISGNGADKGTARLALPMNKTFKQDITSSEMDTSVRESKRLQPDNDGPRTIDIKDETVAPTTSTIEQNHASEESTKKPSAFSWLFGFLGYGGADTETTTTTTTNPPASQNHFWDSSQRDVSWDTDIDWYYDNEEDDGDIFIYEHNFIDYDGDEKDDYDLFADYNDILGSDGREVDRDGDGMEETDPDENGEVKDVLSGVKDVHIGVKDGHAYDNDSEETGSYDHKKNDGSGTTGAHNETKEYVNNGANTSSRLQTDTSTTNSTGVPMDGIGDAMVDKILGESGSGTTSIPNKVAETVDTSEVESTTPIKDRYQSSGDNLASGDSGSSSTTEWSTWSECSKTCGYGQKQRIKSCGDSCTHKEVVECKLKSCHGMELSDFFPTAPPSLDSDEQRNDDVDACAKWASCKDDFMQRQLKDLDNLPSCPCYYPIGLEYESQVWDPETSDYVSWAEASGPEEHLNAYKPGAVHCIRSKLVPNSGVYSAQHCCYDAWMQLITRGRGAGTPNLVSPELSYILHYKIDVLPWIVCNGDWERYNEVLPPNNKQQCSQNPTDFDFRKQLEEKANT